VNAAHVLVDAEAAFGPLGGPEAHARQQPRADSDVRASIAAAELARHRRVGAPALLLAQLRHAGAVDGRLDGGGRRDRGLRRRLRLTAPFYDEELSFCMQLLFSVEQAVWYKHT